MKLKDLILNYLPMCLRKVGIYALIKVLLSPLVRVYETYLSWIEEKRKQVSYTGQQCMLRQIVKDELGVDIVISSLDGKPYDFMVTIQGEITDTMRNRLTALIEKYKPGYKSWRYSDAGQDDIITYSAEWVEYVEQALQKIGIKLVMSTGGNFYFASDISVYEDVRINIVAHIKYFIAVDNKWYYIDRETYATIKAGEKEAYVHVDMYIGDRYNSSVCVYDATVNLENIDGYETMYYISDKSFK